MAAPVLHRTRGLGRHGLVLDWGRSGAGLPDHVVWGLAWSTLGLGGLLGPLAIWRLRRMPEAVRLAGGKR